MKVSVVVPTYNSSADLLALLQSLTEQTYPDFDVIIVDDPRTTDETEKVVKSYADKLSLRYIKTKKEGPSSARNTGILSTDSKIICFIDSDCVAHERWVEQIVRCLVNQDNKIGGVRGKVLPMAKKLITRILSSGLYIPQIHRGATDNLSYRREVLVEAGLFDEEIKEAANEDGDLAWRIRKAGYEIEYCDEALVFHSYTFNVKRFLKREIRFGRGFFLAWRKSKDIRAIAPIIFGLFALTFLTISLITNFGFFFSGMAAVFVSIGIYYRQYFRHFLKQMSFLYLPVLVAIYITKNLCNIFGFLSECLSTSKKA